MTRKNRELFLTGAAQILTVLPTTHFLVAGDGQQRSSLERLSRDLAIADSVHFLGSRNDVPQLLTALDLLALSSHNEASPVSILLILAPRMNPTLS